MSGGKMSGGKILFAGVRTKKGRSVDRPQEHRHGSPPFIPTEHGGGFYAYIAAL